MTDYTPTTEDVRDCYTYAMLHTTAVSRHQIQFDRWLAGVKADEREKIAQAIEAAAYTLTSQDAGVVALSIKRQAAKVARSGGESA